MDRAIKKAKKRQKREQKRREVHKQQSVSPHRIVETASRIVECRINADWREKGVATLMVLSEARGLGWCMASFMMDVWCLGLKDAQGAFGIAREVYDDILKRTQDMHDADFVAITPERAAQLVAGAIRFGRRNGFRISGETLKWSSFLSGQGLGTADESDFGYIDVDGSRKLHWVGSLDDLRRRLVGSTVEEFIARPDVHCSMEVTEGGLSDGLNEWDGDDQDEGELDEDEEVPEDWAASLGRVAQRMVRVVRDRMPDDAAVKDEELEVAAMAVLMGSFEALASSAKGADDPQPHVHRKQAVYHFARQHIEKHLGCDEYAQAALRAVDAVWEVMVDPSAQEALVAASDNEAPALLIEPDGRRSDLADRG